MYSVVCGQAVLRGRFDGEPCAVPRAPGSITAHQGQSGATHVREATGSASWKSIMTKDRCFRPRTKSTAAVVSDGTRGAAFPPNAA